jgi:hypothetical protein
MFDRPLLPAGEWVAEVGPCTKDFYVGGEDERTQIELLFRNLNHRPVAMIDIYVREKDRSILGESGYNNNIKLPIQLEPWGVIEASFRIEKK